jgi:hypothetical protein
VKLSQLGAMMKAVRFTKGPQQMEASCTEPLRYWSHLDSRRGSIPRPGSRNEADSAGRSEASTKGEVRESANRADRQ